MDALRFTTPLSRPLLRRAFLVPATDMSGHGHALAVLPRVRGSTTSSTPTPLRSVRGFRLIVRANSSKNINNNGDSKRGLFICFAVCLLIKLYYVFKDKIAILMKTEALMRGKNYVSLAMTVFAVLKAIYGSLKLAKDIRELLRYYMSSKKTDAK